MNTEKKIEMNRAPRIIHQTWKTKTIPAWAERYHASWKRHHPDWVHILWTDDECRGYVAKMESAEFLATYDRLPKHIMRVDAVRYVWLYWIGGLYADLDMECLQSFELFRQRYELVMGRSHHQVISNSIMLSRPGHPFWRLVLQELVRRADGPVSLLHQLSPSLNVLHVTGPGLVNDCAKKFALENQPGSFIVAKRVFFPYNCWEFWKRNQWRRNLEKGDNLQVAMTAHHHQTTWAPHIKVLRGIIMGSVVVVAILFLALIVSWPLRMRRRRRR